MSKENSPKTIEKGKLNMDFNLRSKAMGIHFDSVNLHAVGVRNNINQLLYKGWEVLPNFENRSDDEVQDFIEEFQGRKGIKPADTFLLLPRSEVICQIAEFPSEAANNLDEAMEYQLVNYFALDREEYDFFPQIVGRGDQLKVMIIAIKKALLGHCFGFIRRWDLKLAGLSLDTFGLVNGYARLEPDRFSSGQTMIFRGFPEGLEVIGVRDGSIVLSEYFAIERLETNPDNESDEEDDVTRDEAFLAHLDEQALVKAVEKTFSSARMDPNEVDTYRWVGDYQHDVRDYLTDEVGLPFDDWKDGNGETIDEGALVGFGGAVGAVHDNVPFECNLLPEKQRKRHKRLPVILGSAALVIAALFLVFSQVKGYMGLREESRNLKTTLNKFEANMNEVAIARGILESRKEELELYKRFQTSKMLVKIVASMANDLPADTYLNSLIIKNENELAVQGESDQPFDLQRVLDKMPFLRDVKSTNAITPGRNKDGKSRFMYKATIILEELH